MYPYLVSELENKCTSDEWRLISSYIYRARDLGEANKDNEAREALLDAIAVAAAAEENNAAGKVQYYLRFY